MKADQLDPFAELLFPRLLRPEADAAGPLLHQHAVAPFADREKLDELFRKRKAVPFVQLAAELALDDFLFRHRRKTPFRTVGHDFHKKTGNGAEMGLFPTT